MDIYSIGMILLTLAVLIGYLNDRFVKMQTNIAITAGAFLLSFIAIIIGQIGFPNVESKVAAMMQQIPFHSILVKGMLSFLLFAGASRIDINHLRSRKWEIGILAGFGTIASTLAVGGLTYIALPLFGIKLGLIYCMLFGALISPTDPIAVLATFKDLGVPKGLQVIVEGESLFNDGIGIVIFLTLYQVAFGGGTMSFRGVTLLFLQSAIGGMLYGGLIGFIAYWLIKSVHDYKITILISILIVTGGYSLALALNISGPLAMVVAGIFIGNRGKTLAMSPRTVERLGSFWELVESLLNIILFLLIGLELLAIPITKSYIIAILYAIPAVILVRTIIVSLPIKIFKRRKKYPPGTTRILIWGGLRGALPFALALSLPPDQHRNLILAMTYAIVAFSIIIQGITLRPLVKLSKKEPPPQPPLEQKP